MRMRLLIALVLLTSPVWAAVTQTGSPTLCNDLVGGTSYSCARTVTSGAKGLVLLIPYYNASGAVTPPTMNWNTSEAFTLVTSGANTPSGSDRRCAIYFRANPTAGSFNVTGTFSNTVFYRSALIELSNASATHDGANANGDSTSASVNVGNVVSGEWVVDAVINGANVTPTPGAGQSTTGLFAAQITGSTYGGASIDSSTTGTVASTWTVDSSWAICAAALDEDAGGGGVTPRLLLLGVGP